MDTDIDRQQRRFWAINTAVWAVYVAFNLFLGATFFGWYSGMVAISVMLGALLCLSSGLLRWRALRHGWLQRDGLALALRLCGGVLAGATATQLLLALLLVPMIGLGWVELPGGRADYRPSAAFGYWVNTAIVLGLWAAGWAGWRSLRRARQSELARLKAESERHALERDALRARLNPHFVFNALNNLRALINEDPARAREMVTRLSSTLRHALEHNAQEWVPLADELQVVEDYLAIEQIHYEQRLRVRREWDDAVRTALIPPMALQLLVENAIKHGIAVTPGGGELTLRIALEARTLRVEVGNPGRIGRGESAGHGVGLAYLRERLARSERPGRFELRQQGTQVLACLEIPQ
ncbi:sensor histidine kinase [Pseudoxanthomonas mexicana]|uniref:sensor histidine kinase n=1 Tax=Pseudoxanthomonas mexicana TaxID=128785 RepID=UPI00398B95EB